MRKVLWGGSSQNMSAQTRHLTERLGVEDGQEGFSEETVLLSLHRGREE